MLVSFVFNLHHRKPLSPARFEYFCKGIVLKRMTKSRKARCACASDATRGHGLYFELTYKAKPKRSTSRSRRKRLGSTGL